MGNPNIVRDGEKTRFKKGCKSKGGRPKNVFKKYAEKFQLSQQDVKYVIDYILSKDLKSLEKMAKEENAPAMIIALVSIAHNAIQQGDIRVLESMLNRSIGKVEDNTNLKIDGKVILQITQDLLPDAGNTENTG